MVRGRVRALRGLIYSKYDSESECAKSLGWNRQRLSKITLGQKEPSIDELNSLSGVLDVSVGELAEIFLNNKSPNGQRTDVAEKAG